MIRFGTQGARSTAALGYLIARLQRAGVRSVAPLRGLWDALRCVYPVLASIIRVTAERGLRPRGVRPHPAFGPSLSFLPWG
jgi:hypothetical protein